MSGDASLFSETKWMVLLFDNNYMYCTSANGALLKCIQDIPYSMFVSIVVIQLGNSPDPPMFTVQPFLCNTEIVALPSLLLTVWPEAFVVLEALQEFVRGSVENGIALNDTSDRHIFVSRSELRKSCVQKHQSVCARREEFSQ